MYEVGCFFEVFDERVEFAFSVGEYLHPVMDGEAGTAQLVSQGDLLLAFGRQFVARLRFVALCRAARHALQDAPLAF